MLSNWKDVPLASIVWFNGICVNQYHFDAIHEFQKKNSSIGIYLKKIIFNILFLLIFYNTFKI